MGVDHCGAYFLVAEEFPDRANIISTLEEMGGERMMKGVTGNPWLGVRPVACYGQKARHFSVNLLGDKRYLAIVLFPQATRTEQIA